jgi:hypothetical protein
MGRGLLFFSCLFALAALPAQARLVYEFNGTTEGFSAANVTGFAAGATSANWTYCCGDPILNSPGALSVATATDRYFILDLTFNPSPSANDDFQLFFNVGAGFNEADSQHFTIQPGRRSYLVDLGANPEWTGTCTQFRVDPGVGPAGGTASINWMGFVSGPREWEFAADVEGWTHSNFTSPGNQTAIAHDGNSSMQVAFGLAGNSPGDVTVQAPANSIVPGLTDWMRVEFNLSDPDANIGLPTNFASFMFPITGGYQYTQFGSRYPNLGKQTVIYNHNRTNNGPGTLWGVDSVSTFRFDTPDGVGTDAAWNNVNWLFDAVRFTASPADSAPYSWGFASTLDNWTAFPFNGFAGTATNSVGKAIISGSGTGNVLFGNWGVAVDTVAARKLVVDLAVARSSGASDVPLRLFFDNDTAGLGTESVSTSIPSQFIDGVQRRYTFDMIAHKNAGSRTWGTNDYLRFVTALAMQLNANGNNIPIIGIESIDLVADAEAPSLSAVERFSPTGASTSSNTVTFMVTLNERVNNIDIGDFTLVTGGGLTGGSVTGVTPLMGINGYSERVQVTVSGYAGSGSLGLVVTPGSNMTDGVGNVVNSAAIPPTNQLYSIDQDPPTISIGAPSDTDINSSASTDFVITYTGASSVSLTQANVTLNHSGTSGGTVSVTGSGTGARTVTVSNVGGNGTFTISLAAGTAVDAAGNSALAAGPSALVNVDNVAPTISIGAPVPNAVNASGSTVFTITYGGTSAVTLASGDVTLNHVGTSGGTIVVAGSGFITRTVTVSNVSGEGTFRISIAGGTAIDVASNPAPAAGPSALVTVDNNSPIPTLTTVAPAQVNGPISVSVTTEEPTTNFTQPDVTRLNGNISAFSGSGSSYSFTFTPIINGNFSMTIDANRYTDTAGNANFASSPLVRVFDNVPPLVFNESPARGGTIASLGSIQVNFDDLMSGVSAANLTVNGSPATSVTGSGAGPYTFSGYATPASGPVNVVLAAGATTDDATNAFAGDAWSYTLNAAVPTVQFTSSTVPDGGFINTPVQFTATFSENIDLFTATDITVTNAVNPVSNFSGSGSVYTFTVNPLSSGVVTVQLPANRVVAQAPPNTPNPASAVYSFTYDVVPPVIVLNGLNLVVVDCKEGYTDAGVQSATDNIDGNMIAQVVQSGDMITPFSPPDVFPYDYIFTVTDRAGNTTQVVRPVTVSFNCSLNVLRASPELRVIEEGGSVTLSVSVTDALGTLTYDWQKETTPGNYVSLGAPDQSTFTLTNAVLTDTGKYQCVVSDVLATNASPVFRVFVGGEGLPLGGALGMAALAALTGLGGALGLRRRK